MRDAKNIAIDTLHDSTSTHCTDVVKPSNGCSFENEVLKGRKHVLRKDEGDLGSIRKGIGEQGYKHRVI